MKYAPMPIVTYLFSEINLLGEPIGIVFSSGQAYDAFSQLLREPKILAVDLENMRIQYVSSVYEAHEFYGEMK